MTRWVRFVNPFGRATFVSPFKLRSRKTRPVRLGRLKLLNRFWDRSRLFNRVRLAGKVGLPSRLLLRLSETKLLADSRPARLLMLRWLASRFVRLCRSWTVKGPVGFARAAR